MIARRIAAATAGVAVLACGGSAPAPSEPDAPDDWRPKWGVERGYSLTAVGRGYDSPTAIVFVPRPGAAPTDPRYFVTELKGVVKVVTNDGAVHTFASEALDIAGLEETGMAGICLDATHGYVFVTYAAKDTGGIVRNHMVRYTTTPGTFGTRTSARRAFDDVLGGYNSSISHHIGPCQVQGNTVFVSIGDGDNPPLAQRLNVTNGKILRMTLDGDPVSDNPFRVNNEHGRIENYVWAYGFRNPFGQKLVGDRLFIAGNGIGIDQFVEVHRGENHHWNGTDHSIGANAIQIIAPSIGPVHLEYVPGPDPRLHPSRPGAFYVAASGNLPTFPNPTSIKPPGVMMLDYDLASRAMRSPPRYLVRYTQSNVQIVAALALGPDGLYFAPMMPDSGGVTFIYRVAADSAREHPVRLHDESSAAYVMERYGCTGCHQQSAGGDGTVPWLSAPTLVPRLRERLMSAEYEASLRALDTVTTGLTAAHSAARAEVLRASGLERVRTWIKHRVLEPRFDNPRATMPTLGLSEEQAANVAIELTAQAFADENQSLKARIGARLPEPSRSGTVLAFVLGGALGLAVALLAQRRRLRRQ